MTANSAATRKAKGRRLQSWTAQMISKIIHLPCGRDELIAPREMGQSGVDVRLVDKALRMFPWSVENKYQESWSVHQWIKQAKDNELPNTNWLLIAKRNHNDPVVILDARVFFKMYELMYGMLEKENLKEKIYKHIMEDPEKLDNIKL